LSHLLTNWGGPGWQQYWQDRFDVQFGRWASKAVSGRGSWDAVISMSCISLELSQTLKGLELKILHHGSFHIEAQHDLLLREQRESNKPIRLSSPLIIQRELQEYQLCTRLTVISPEARASFVGKPIEQSKIDLLLLGIDEEVFAAKGPEHEARKQRYNGSKPLRVVSAGSFSRRKGSAVWDKLFQHYPKEQVHFRIVGEINPDSKDVYDRHRRRVEFLPRVLEQELPRHYQWADLFLLPTVGRLRGGCGPGTFRRAAGTHDHGLRGGVPDRRRQHRVGGAGE
jgi:glycosyltransferase involved in cell wall biosynthesis